MPNVLAALTLARVLERARPRPGHASNLRVTPRFLDHLDMTSLRLLPERIHTNRLEALENALRTWDTYNQDPREGAAFLESFLRDRDQAAPVAPRFPALEQFQPRPTHMHGTGPIAVTA